MPASAHLYDADGRPVGGVTQQWYSKIVPAYQYRLLGPTPVNGWRDMPDFSKLTELRTGVMGLMTPDRAEQINRSLFAGLSPFGHIEVRIHELYNLRTLKLNGQLRIPADGDYEFKVRATGRAELVSGQAVLGACVEMSKARTTRGRLPAGVYPFTIRFHSHGVFNDLNIQVKGPSDVDFVPFETLVLPISDWQQPDTLISLPAETRFREENAANKRQIRASQD